MKRHLFLILTFLTPILSSYSQVAKPLTHNDSLKVMAKSLTGKWRMVESQTSDTLFHWPKTGIIEVMELDLADHQTGSMHEDSMKNGEWLTFSTCQSKPRVKLKDGQFSIHFTDPLGNRELEIELTGNQLSLKSEAEIYRYAKIEN